jgi:hypothetical protein
MTFGKTRTLMPLTSSAAAAGSGKLNSLPVTEILAPLDSPQ